MKISVVGGGPGGLYFALLTKKRRPDIEVELYEQNRADDTFGFGVVFSDDTLDEFLGADPETYELIRDHFAYWTDMIVEQRGLRSIVAGNGFAGCGRMALLQILQRRCKDVGVKLNFAARVEIEQIETDFADSDIIVDAGGINSPIRERYSENFGAEITETRNKFVWLGSTCSLDGFTFFFKETEHGIICAHTYQYEAGHSTWVIETTPECWLASGYGDLSEEENARALEDVFKDELNGHPLIVNRSLWRNFPTIKCESWHHKNIVLLGDCKATAHWSIGSGTKLAMECAAALSDAVVQNGANIEAAFSAYEAKRRTPIEITQHNAQVSLRWFENMPIHWNKTGEAFVFSCMSRAKSITWDNLKLRDPAFLEKFEIEYYQRFIGTKTEGIALSKPTPMFMPLSLRSMTIPNRVAMAPMAQYCAVDGMPQPWHFSHYSSRAVGGVGLIFTEMTCPTPDARITDGCTGLWSEAQQRAWQELVEFIHNSTSTKIAMQLGHAGRKGSTKAPADGMDMPKDSDNWPIYSASPIPYIEDTSAIPIELDQAKMDEILNSFVQAGKRADAAGFDMLELHCAHGYLLASFLSPLTNQRLDQYGGTIENRLRYPLEVFKAVRAMWPENKPMSVRLSSCDWAEGGLTLDDLEVICKAFKGAGVDIIHASSGETVKWQKPTWGRMWQTPFAEHIKQHVGIPTIAVGDITKPEQINTIIADERADICALGRPHLNDAFFTRKAAGHYGVENQSWPSQLHSGRYQLFREAEKDNEKLLDLSIKARPDLRHDKKT